MGQFLIQLENVSKRFGQNIVLDEANLSICQGEITSVIGKSGVGKSVLLKHIIGLIEPDSGRILFQGQPLSKMKKEDKQAFKRKFSYVFQGTALFDSMNVFENIALPLRERTSLGEGEIQRQVRDKMGQLDLEKINNEYPSQISGGMKKRVALARALITDPEIVLFDEPTTGLDPIRKNAVHSMISDYQKKFGFTGVMVSHEIPDIFYISQRLAMIEEGRILFEGTPEEIQQTQDTTVQQFIKGLEIRHDVLTGMPPQPQGEERFNEEMSRLLRHHIAFSVIIFTVGNLEEINEKAGHVTGQIVLQKFAAELQRNLRLTDTSYRYGLNKIVVVLTHTDRDQARMTCAKLSREIDMKKIFGIEGLSEMDCTVTVGFAEVEEAGSIEKILSNAESMQNTLDEFCFY